VKRQYRIKKQEDFHRIIHSSQFVKNQQFVVYYQCNNLNFARVGVSVPKKLGIAVVRNKIKRQIQATLQEALALDASADYVIVPKTGFDTGNYQQSRAALMALLEKIGDQHIGKID